MTKTEEPRVKEYKVSSENLLDKVKELVHQGNVRHIVIKDEKEHTLVEFPLSVGVVGALLLPVWAAISAIAVFASNFTVVVSHSDEPAK